MIERAPLETLYPAEFLVGACRCVARRKRRRNASCCSVPAPQIPRAATERFRALAPRAQG